MKIRIRVSINRDQIHPDDRGGCLDVVRECLDCYGLKRPMETVKVSRTSNDIQIYFDIKASSNAWQEFAVVLGSMRGIVEPYGVTRIDVTIYSDPTLPTNLDIKGDPDETERAENG